MWARCHLFPDSEQQFVSILAALVLQRNMWFWSCSRIVGCFSQMQRCGGCLYKNGKVLKMGWIFRFWIRVRVCFFLLFKRSQGLKQFLSRKLEWQRASMESFLDNIHYYLTVFWHPVRWVGRLIMFDWIYFLCQSGFCVLLFSFFDPIKTSTTADFDAFSNRKKA